jgi:uncharacterized protein YbaP (TraB family)
MLKKSRYIFSLLLVFALGLEARSLLYKVSSEQSTVYILGSIHLAKAELYPLDEAIVKAYEKSDVLVVEVDPSSEVSVSMMQEVMSDLGMYPPGMSLKTQLSENTYKSLLSYTKKIGLSIDEMQRMKPWVVMLQLTVTEMMHLGYSPELGIDNYFLDRAKAENKTVAELETAAEQMALLSKDDDAFQDKLLLYTLESMTELEPLLKSMFDSWKNGESDKLEKIISLPLDEDPSIKEIYDELITKRNYKMSEKIEGFLKSDKDYFVVVGSGHVIGKEGIVNLLQRQGFRVIQE